jgi:hypothetical protein
MKLYYVERFGSTHATMLQAGSLDEAIAEVKHDYANCGEKKVIERTYKLISQRTIEVDTNY